MIRTKGYSAARVEDICEAARLTKGAFFHHFESKEALAVAAAQYWTQRTGALFASAPYHAHEDPLERVLAYIEFRRQLIQGRLPEFTCLVGTMVQETYASHPPIRDACAASITGHAGTLVADIAEARRRHCPSAEWTAESLALHTQAVLQGAFIVAKATDDPGAAIASIDHLSRYVRLLFGRTPPNPRE